MQKIVYLNSYYLILKIKKIIQITCNNKNNENYKSFHL